MLYMNILNNRENFSTYIHVHRMENRNEKLNKKTKLDDQQNPPRDA